MCCLFNWVWTLWYRRWCRGSLELARVKGFTLKSTTGNASSCSVWLVLTLMWRCSTPHHSYQNCCYWGPVTLSPPPPPPPPISYFWWGGAAVKSQWCHFRMWESGKVSWFCGEWCVPSTASVACTEARSGERWSSPPAPIQAPTRSVPLLLLRSRAMGPWSALIPK